MLHAIETRFRAYQLGTPGASFSYATQYGFSLVEGRLNELNYRGIREELGAYDRYAVKTFGLTSWDCDHCNARQVGLILENFCPSQIEIPGYLPETEEGWAAYARLAAYQQAPKAWTRSLVQFSPFEISKLPQAPLFGYGNVLYHPTAISDTSNDNSTIQLYRCGSFTVLSLGDVEDPVIASRLMNCPILRNEVDVVMLAHHGADNGFTTERLIRSIRPAIAVACSEHGNQFEHPADAVCQMLQRCEVPLYTTKHGDVLVKSEGAHNGLFSVRTLYANRLRRDPGAQYISKRALRHLGLLKTA